MSDIVDYAITKLTDFVKFEQLAIEVLKREGFGTVIPIGGVADSGIDAEEVKYYKDGTSTKVIYQFTLQKNIASKITDTAKKLSNIEYDELVIVTPNEVGNIEHYRTKYRKTYSKKLEIIERNTFLSSLGNDSLLFNRYFPSIKQQISSDFFDSKSVFSNSKNQLDSTLLKCSLLFTFNKEADKTRKDLFEQTILTLIVSNVQFENKSELIKKFRSSFHKELQDSEIDSILTSLRKKDFIEKGDVIKPTQIVLEKIESNLANVNSMTSSLIGEIISRAKSIYESPIDRKMENKIEENIKNSFSGFFSLYGLEYANNGLGNNPVISEDIIAITKKGIPDKLGDSIVYIIGELINNPNDSQIEILANWARAFVAIQIMGLDPKLKNIQTTKISQKTFIIDTDFLLYCLVGDCSISNTYKRVIKELLKLRCKIFIPEKVVHEAIKHAQHAINSYTYFKNKFQSIDAIIIEDKIANIFVKGYFYKLRSSERDTNELSFQTYIDNFFYKNSPYDFFIELIKAELPGEIVIGELSDLDNNFETDIQSKGQLIEAILEETKKTFKSTSRTEEENLEVATTDAELYLFTHRLNSNSNENEILSGSHYILTSSTRAQKCAKKMGYKGNVICKPSTAIDLLERIGSFHPSSKEIVNLFENPYLVHAVNNSWDDIAILIESGIDLKGKNVVKLRYDLDDTIKDFIDFQNKEVSSKSTDSDELYINKLIGIKKIGYKLVPELDLIINKIEELESTNEIQGNENKGLKEALGKFSKRKQHYLDRISGNKK